MDCKRLFRCARFSCPTDLTQYSLLVFATNAAASSMQRARNERSKPASSAFFNEVTSWPMKMPMPARQPPTATQDMPPTTTVATPRRRLHCMGLPRMNRTTGHTACGARSTLSSEGAGAAAMSFSCRLADARCIGISMGEVYVGADRQ
jgi:hypothetical protein